jgi:SOS response regulatory protein OraA/RecX
MPRVTALRREGSGRRVGVELDGAAWRTLPLEVVVRARLEVGRELDRARVRTLRRELRRHEALEVGARALRRRPLSARRLEERLARQEIAPAERARALEALTRAGLVDDERFATERAEALAERGLGDAAIRFALERERLEPAAVEAALERLEPERERAARVVARRGAGVRTARLLARRGFGEDAVEAAAAPSVADEGAGELG